MADEPIPLLARATERRNFIIDRIIVERYEQIIKKGYDAAHDDRHDEGDLAVQAAGLCLGAGCGYDIWQLAEKHPDRREQLTIAAALLIAELERLARKDDQ